MSPRVTSDLLLVGSIPAASTEDALRARYPRRAEYERGWIAAVDALVESGALRPEDAAATRAPVAEVRRPF